VDKKLQELATAADITKGGSISYVEFLHAFNYSVMTSSPDSKDAMNILEDVLDDMIIVLYSNRRALRKALQYFDQDETDQVNATQLTNALQGIINNK
jgi:Ca2+-binding EF-hand superfamily protein